MVIHLVLDGVGGADRTVTDVSAGHVSGNEFGVGHHVVADHTQRQKAAGRVSLSIIAAVDDVVPIVTQRRHHTFDFA